MGLVCVWLNSFYIWEGRQHNHFIRGHDVTAHLLIKNVPAPRLIVAFPEANSGIGIWLGNGKFRPLKPDALQIYHKGNLRGIRCVLEVEGDSIEVARILLNSIRILRNFVHLGYSPGRQSH